MSDSVELKFPVVAHHSDAAEMSRFDERLKQIPGLKMVL